MKTVLLRTILYFCVCQRRRSQLPRYSHTTNTSKQNYSWQ